MRPNTDMIGTLDARAAVLMQQVEAHRHQAREAVARARKARAKFRESRASLHEVNELRRSFGSSKVSAMTPPAIHPPRTGATGQFAWIINLLQANPDGLTSNQITTFLAPVITSKSRNRKKVLSSALSSMRTDGRVALVGGVYRLS